MCAQRKAGRRQRLPSVPFPWSLAVHYQSLASTLQKTKRLRRRLTLHDDEVDFSSKQLKPQKLQDKTSIVYDHKDNPKVGGRNPLADTKWQFCTMLYHVKERKRDKISLKCLKKCKYRVGNSKMTRPHSNSKAFYARTVVLYVRLIDRVGRLVFRARYGICFQGKIRKQFM